MEFSATQTLLIFFAPILIKQRNLSLESLSTCQVYNCLVCSQLWKVNFSNLSKCRFPPLYQLHDRKSNTLLLRLLFNLDTLSTFVFLKSSQFFFFMRKPSTTFFSPVTHPQISSNLLFSFLPFYQ